MKKLLIIFSLAILAGCYYDTEEELYPYEVACDTTNVTFSGTVYPIISSACGSCHTGSAPEAGVLLADHESIKSHALIPAGQPGSLYGAITHDPLNSAMPKNGTPLSDCKILQIKVWIDAGLPNN